MSNRALRFRHRPVVQLGDGEIGYCMDPGHSPARGPAGSKTTTTRLDDCLRPSVATVLQVPVEQVPDPRIDRRLAAGDSPEQIVSESWARLEDWVERRGLSLVFHDTDDTVPDRDRWIGVCGRGADANPDDLFLDHCVVMCHHRVLFDPAISIPAEPGKRVRRSRLSDVEYGISFDPKGDQEDA